MLVVLSGGGTAGHINPALAVAEVLQERGCDVRFAGCLHGRGGAARAPGRAAVRALRGRRLQPPPSAVARRRARQDPEEHAGRQAVVRRGASGRGGGLWRVRVHPRGPRRGGLRRAGGGARAELGHGHGQQVPGPPGAHGVRDLRAVRRRRGRAGPRARHGQPGARLGARRHPRRGADASGRARRRAHAARVRREPGRAADQRGRGRLQGRPAGRAWPARRAHHRAAPAGKRAAGARARAGRAKTRWHVMGYQDRMGETLAAADAVVSRSGATSLAEISARAIPALLVPFPHATEDHQTKNAQAYVDAGCAYLLPDDRVATRRVPPARALARAGARRARAHGAGGARAEDRRRGAHIGRCCDGGGGQGPACTTNSPTACGLGGRGTRNREV